MDRVPKTPEELAEWWQHRDRMASLIRKRLADAEQAEREFAVEIAVAFEVARLGYVEASGPLVPLYLPDIDTRRGNAKNAHEVYNAVRLTDGTVVHIRPVYRTCPIECILGVIARSNTTYARSIVQNAANAKFPDDNVVLRFINGSWCFHASVPFVVGREAKKFKAVDTPGDLQFEEIPLFGE